MPEAEPNSSAHSYEVLGKLAEGGTTEIFLARAKGIGAVERVVVLKRLKRSVTSHVDLVKVFLEEARLASQLQHPNIAQVFEVGKLGGSYFFAMEFINGETLQSLMHHARSRKIQIPVRAVLTIAAAIAAGLHHAHDRKGSDGKPLAVVHGEVSPTNTLVSQEGIVKLVDFGVAKAGELGHGRVSPHSSPEQCRGDALDRRSDLFSLGILLWELLTLDPLYQRASDDEIKLAIEYEVPAKPSAKRYDVPPELDAMVSKLLAKDPNDRFQDADELLASIEALAQKLSILLSTADLSRMMRLWFGTKSEPTVDPDAPDAAQSLVVSSEAIPDDLAATHHTPVDDQLDAVRSAAALITARATARAGSTTGRQDKNTVPPELMDNPNENFEQIRDRILARARQKKETKQGVVAGTSSSGTLPPPMAGTGTLPPAMAGTGTLPPPMGVAAAAITTAAATSAPTPATGATAPAASDVGTPILRITPHDRHSRTTAQAPLAVIADAVRRTASDAPEHTNGVNGHPSAAAADDPDAKSDEPDKVVVDEELTGSRSASGELGNKGTSGVISRHEAKVSVSAEMAAVEPPREAPPATENVATPEVSVERTEVESRVQAQAASDATGAATDDAEGAETAAETSSDADEDRAESTMAARDLDRDREREVEHTERVHATTRASTADIARPPQRPAWLLPVLGAAALLLVFLLVLKLRGGNETQANPQPTQAQRTQPQNTGTSAVVDPGSAARAGSAADPNAEKLAAEKLAADKLAADKLAAEKLAADKLAADKLAADKLAADKLAAEKLAAEKQAAEKQAAEKQAAEKQAAEKQAAEKQAAEKKAAEKLAAEKQAQKQPVDKQPVEKKQPETKKGIEELFAAGEFGKTNTACTKEIVFTAQKLVMCAEAACQTRNSALAKRWINAIAKAQRPELIEKCKSLGVELASPSPASPPAAPPPASPPAEAPPAGTK